MKAWRSLRVWQIPCATQPAIAAPGSSLVRGSTTQHELAADRLGVPARLFSAGLLGGFLSWRAERRRYEMDGCAARHGLALP